LYFDIETSPNIGLFWSAGWKQTIDYSNIIKERSIICICYKWEGEKAVRSLTWDSKQNDKKMLAEFVKIANTAEELVGHNGDKFDMAWIRTRCLYHRIPMFPTYTTIDTLKVSRSKFRFNSNRLNYIADFLGLGQKRKVEFNLWKDVLLKNDRKALDTMVKYCKRDVSLLQDVFTELSKHIEPKTHYGVINGKERGTCPECGGDHLVFQRIRVTATGIKRYAFSCRGCGKYHSKSEKQGKLVYECNG
jgi:uncharacterized protein YprB with RNaseH-like and TPR domain